MRPLLVRDKPDALGETWCWRFSLIANAALVVALVAAVAWKHGYEYALRASNRAMVPSV